MTSQPDTEQTQPTHGLDPNALVGRLRHLVSLNDPERGGPYQGAAATACVDAMREAADLLAALSQNPGTSNTSWEAQDNPILPNDVLLDNQARALKADGASGSMVIDTSVVIEMVGEIMRRRAALEPRASDREAEECVYTVLREHYLSNMVFDGTEEPYLLVDAVTAQGKGIDDGEEQLRVLASYIAAAIRKLSEVSHEH